MRNKGNTNENQHKIKVFLDFVLIFLIISAVAFSAGYYLATAQIAAIWVKPHNWEKSPIGFYLNNCNTMI